MTEITIRPLEADDLPQLLRMVRALAAFHGDTAQVTRADLARDCLGPAPWLQVLLAGQGGALCGYAALSPRVQLQMGARGMDLHHLYVDPARRGQGVGQALITAAARAARAQGAQSLLVGTAPGNAAAQGFYLSQGFRDVTRPSPRFARDL